MDTPRIALWMGFLVVAGWAALPAAAQNPPESSLRRIREASEADRLDDAEGLARDEMARRLSAPTRDDLRSATDLLALVKEIQGSGRRRLDARTVELARRVETVQEAALGGTIEVAHGLADVAEISFHAGDFAVSRALFERSLKVFDEIPGSGVEERVGVLDVYSWLLYYLGDCGEAEARARQGLKLLEEAGGPRPGLEASLLNTLGTCRTAAGELEAALRYHRVSLEIYERLPGEDLDVANLRNNVGRLLLATGDPEAAVPMLEASLATLERLLGPTHAGIGIILRNLALAYDLTGREAAAAPLFERALRLHRRAYGTRNPQVAMTLGLSAAFLARHGHWAEAMDEALEAEAIRRSHVRRTIRELGQQQALDYVSRPELALDVAVALALRRPTPEAPRRAWDAVIRSRALVLDEMAARSRRRAALPEEPGEDVGFSAVASALPAGSALVGISLRGDGLAVRTVGAPAPRSTYVAFVLRAGASEPQIVELAEAAELDRRIERWRDQISRHSVQRYLVAGERLREALWDPVAPLLEGTNRVFFVPDGKLHLVNLATLPSADGSFLVEEDRVVHYLSAERDLLTPAGPAGRVARASSSTSGLLAVGSPGFGDGPEEGAVGPGESAPARASEDLRSGCEGLPPIRFEPLPETGREALEVAALFRQSHLHDRQGAEVLLGSAASEGAFRLLAPRHEILHIATHGFFVGSDGCRDPGPAEIESLTNPLLRSGLALAGANRRSEAGREEDDGILTSDEIAALDLSGVRWVVLSACDSGVGDLVAGEGVVGLQRAFRVAGVRTLVMSLWKVDDASTRELMERLYTARFEGGVSVAEAVRAASREVLEQRRRLGLSIHPYYWGAFVAEGYGDS